MTSPLFSIDINIDPGTQETLKTIASALETIAHNLHQNVASGMPKIPDDEPTELSVCIPDDLIERPTKRIKNAQNKTCSPRESDGWRAVAGNRILEWKHENTNVLLKYNTALVNISWIDIGRLSNVPKSRRRIEIQRVLSTTSADSVTAVNVFVSSYIKGIVYPPGINSVAIEDPDAAFKPMVTPYINTRPADDCGSIESLQGAY